MTHVIDSSILLDHVVPVRVCLPRVPAWVVPRPRVAERLDLGVSGVVTVVTAAAGWGKSQAVASWATSAELPGALVWLNVAETGADPDLFWDLLYEGLIEAGQRHIAPVPAMGSHERRRLHAIAVLGMALRRTGPWVLVLDDYPTGPTGQLGADLGTLVKHAQGEIRLVVIGRGEPAMEVHRHQVAGELTRIAGPDLAMDSREVAEVLARNGVVASDLTARTVEQHTAGWPCAVRLAAVALQHTPMLEEAIEQTDKALVEFLASEVLLKAPPPVRDLIVRTSVVDEVSPDLARTVVGFATDDVLGPALVSEGFVEVRQDGAFRCHPLLRAAAVAQLAREPREVARTARRRAAQWYVDRGEARVGLELAMAGADWTWTARALVESYAVPAILTHSAGEVVEQALAVPSIRDAEPLLEAALALRSGGIATAESIVERVRAGAAGGPGEVADRVSALFIGLVAARIRGDVATGIDLAAQTRTLMVDLQVEQQDELSAMLAAQVGALELCSGDPHRAAVTLGQGAKVLPGESGTTARLECLGQLALLEAFQGNLRLAERHAAPVLKPGDSGAAPGVPHAHLATAWVHLERAEPAPARQHLDRSCATSRDDVEPWFGLLQLLAEARLLSLTSQPEAALRLLVPEMRAAQQRKQSGWMVDLLTASSAETMLRSGEPRRALGLVTPMPSTLPLEGGVLVASCLDELGDVAGARQALRQVEEELAGAPLRVQVEYWLLAARLAHGADRVDQARVLADRALRTGAAEALRRPFAPDSVWLAALVEGDENLRRAHGGFLAGLRSPAFGHAVRAADPGRSGPLLVETLTVREAQVLGLLAEMCSTDEIARELFLSVNTVKTYVRGILRKLDVNRRVDAVRRGRELGLC